MVNIIHVLEDFSLSSGGLRTVVKKLNEKLLENGLNSKIVSTRSEVEDDIILVNGGSTPWRYSSNLIKELDQLNNNNKIDLLHIHGVWMYPQYATAKYALKNNIPYIITCHGMLEPWLWTKGKFKKEQYFKHVVYKYFERANYLHAITPLEANELSKLFPKSKIKTIPNLISLNNFTGKSSNFNDKYILYLGRLDEKKGIDILINVFAKLNDKQIRLKIAGGFNDYKNELTKLAKDLNILERIDFLGLVKGLEKEKLYKEAFVFVAPSHSEVIGMVNLEAAKYHTPVITTYQTGLLKEWNNNGGVLINLSKNNLYSELSKAVNWSIEERNLRGQNLRGFIEKEYSWNTKIKDWIHFYKTIKNEKN